MFCINIGTHPEKGELNSVVLPAITSHRFWRIVQMSEKQLPTNPAVGRLKHMVEEVKLTVPVVADLRGGTLMDRHWEVLDDVLGMDLREQGSATFKQMMEVIQAPDRQVCTSQFRQKRFLPAEVLRSMVLHAYNCRTPFGRLIQCTTLCAILELC